jgi:hypothetical protein
MQPRQQQVDPEKGEKQREKSDDGEYGGLFPPPAGGKPAMKQCGIDEPGD